MPWTPVEPDDPQAVPVLLTTENGLFLTTEDGAFLITGALGELWEDEPITPEVWTPV